MRRLLPVAVVMAVATLLLVLHGPIGQFIGGLSSGGGSPTATAARPPALIDQPPVKAVSDDHLPILLDGHRYGPTAHDPCPPNNVRAYLHLWRAGGVWRSYDAYGKGYDDMSEPNGDIKFNGDTLTWSYHMVTPVGMRIITKDYTVYYNGFDGVLPPHDPLTGGAIVRLSVCAGG